MSNFICFVPPLIITVMYYNGPFITQLDLFKTWIITAILSNSSLNSMLFFWLNPWLRYDSITILKQIFEHVMLLRIGIAFTGVNLV